jgi:hypothetical protein
LLKYRATKALEPALSAAEGKVIGSTGQPGRGVTRTDQPQQQHLRQPAPDARPLNRLRLAVGTTSGSGIPVWAVSFRDMFTLLCSILYSKFLSRVVSLILAHRAALPTMTWAPTRNHQLFWLTSPVPLNAERKSPSYLPSRSSHSAQLATSGWLSKSCLLFSLSAIFCPATYHTFPRE